MRKKFRSLAVVVAAAATVAGVGVMAGGGAALAAGGGGATPPWYSQYGAGQGPVGGITFYNAQGQVVTGGDITASGLGAYAVADSADPLAPHTKATLFISTPVSGQNPLTWTSMQLSTSDTYPNTAAPGPIGTTTNAVESNNGTAATGDQSIQSGINNAPNTDTSTTDGFGNLYDIRLRVSGGTGGQTAEFWDAVISVNVIGATTANPGGTGGTWTLDYPDFTQNTTTTLTANPQNQTSTTPAPVTLTATVAPAAAGTVSFWNNSTTPAAQVGTSQTVTATNGVATVTTTPGTGQTPYQAIFTPAVPNSPSGTGFALTSNDIGSQSPVVNTTVGPPPDATATTLAESGGGGPAGPVTFTGTVKDTTTTATTVTAGTVSLFDNGSTTPFATTAVGAGGNFSSTFTYTSAGNHSVVATYSGANGSPGFATSSSAAQTFAETAPACTTCNDVQTIEGTVPAGTISISTPYTPANPLNLGTLALNAAGTFYSATASLDSGSGDVPGVNFNGITVVDTQSGNLPWTVSALSSNLSDGTGHPGGTISGENVGLTNLTPVFVTGNAIQAGDVNVFNQSAATPPVGPTDTGSLGLGGTTAHTIATDTAQPVGTVGINGTVTLNAPTSTEAGVFTGTITFTIAS